MMKIPGLAILRAGLGDAGEQGRADICGETLRFLYFTGAWALTESEIVVEVV